MNILALLAVNTLKISRATLDKYITIALVAAFAMIVIAMVIRKAIMLKKAAKNQNFTTTEEKKPEITAVPSTAPTAPGSAGKIKLHNVDPKTAAMLMAIVADKTGKPLNELRFISIKEIV